MKYIFIIFNSFVFTSFCCAQQIQESYLQLSKDTVNGRLNLIFGISKNEESIAEFPSQSKLIDYIVKSQDSISVIINCSPIFMYTQFIKINGQWTSTNDISWFEPIPKNIDIENKEKAVEYKLQEFDKVIYLEYGKISPFDLSDYKTKKD